MYDTRTPVLPYFFRYTARTTSTAGRLFEWHELPFPQMFRIYLTVSQIWLCIYQQQEALVIIDLRAHLVSHKLMNEAKSTFLLRSRTRLPKYPGFFFELSARFIAILAQRLQIPLGLQQSLSGCVRLTGCRCCCFRRDGISRLTCRAHRCGGVHHRRPHVYGADGVYGCVVFNSPSQICGTQSEKKETWRGAQRL